VKKSLVTIVLCALIIFPFVTAGSVYVVSRQKAPPQTLLVFAHPHYFDFYQYLYFIRMGAQGNFLYSIPYSANPPGPFLLHPLYFISGALGHFGGVSAPITLLLLRIFSLSTLVAVIWFLIRKTIHESTTRIIALLFVMCSTAFWALERIAGSWILIGEIPWSDNFDIYKKWNLPPHYLLATAAFIGILMLIRDKPTVKNAAVATLLGISLGFLHPFFIAGSPLYPCPPFSSDCPHGGTVVAQTVTDAEYHPDRMYVSDSL